MANVIRCCNLRCRKRLPLTRMLVFQSYAFCDASCLSQWKGDHQAVNQPPYVMPQHLKERLFFS